MRTDPRAACKNTSERWGWAILHDLVAHPLMGLTNYSKLSLRFHDWTSHYAWPRVSAEPRCTWQVRTRFGEVQVAAIGGKPMSRIFSVQHPNVAHAFVTNAGSAQMAADMACTWFEVLADEFGGDFTRPGVNDKKGT